MLVYDNLPRKVYIELTEKCNLRCTSCFRNNWKLSPTDMTDEVFLGIYESLPQLKHLESVVMGGIGEPTIHPKFNEYSKKLSHLHLELTSNAAYWTDETIDVMARHYKKVTVSVDGLAKTFRAIRGFEYDQLAENIARLNRKKQELNQKLPVIHAQLVLSTENIGEIEQLVPVLKKTGFSRLVISNLLPQNQEDADKIIYKLHSNEHTRKRVNSWYPVGSANQLPIKLPRVELKTDRKCSFVENGTMFITARGHVTPCYRFAHKGVEYVFGRKKEVDAVYFGNVLEHSVLEIWNNPEYASLRFQNYCGRFPSCMDCDNVEYCDYINTASADCLGNYPSCADCLWTRGFIECP